MAICKDCGEIFLQKHKKCGYIDQCDNCSEPEETYLGRRDDKHGDTYIFRRNLRNWKVTLDRENKVGRTANLPLRSSNGN